MVLLRHRIPPLFMLFVMLPVSPIACADPDSVAEEELAIESALVRAALSVSDIEASKHFYTYALGYEAGFDGDITRSSVTEMLQLADGQTVHFVILRGAKAVGGEDKNSAMIGLLRVDNPPLPVMRRPEGHSLVAGEAMMAILTSDIKMVERRSKELGATILYGPTRSADGSESELVLHDPDGFRIHVVQMHH